MRKGYRPIGNATSENSVPPHGESSIMRQEEKQASKSFGTIIDDLLNNPEVMIVQAGKMLQEAKKETEKMANEKKKLEEALIEKDKEIAYLKGKVDSMEKIISEINAPIELAVEK